MQAVYSRGQFSVNLCKRFIHLHHVHEYPALTSMIQNFLRGLSNKVIFLCERQNSASVVQVVQVLKSLSERTVN